MKILEMQAAKAGSGGGYGDDGWVWVPSPGGGPFDGEWRPTLLVEATSPKANERPFRIEDPSMGIAPP